MTCPATGIRDFPIRLGNGTFNLEDLNKGIEEDLFIYVSWGPRSNAPKFKRNSPLLDEGIEGRSTTSSSLRFNNMDYQLKTVQITRPQHGSFVVGSTASNVKGEVVMIFANTGSMGDSYLFLCIPIIEANASSGSEYIEALVSDRMNRRQLTLDSLIPTKRNCLTYSTCILKRDGGRTIPTNIHSFIFVYGLQETANRIGLLRKASMGAGATEFGALTLPDGLQASTQPALFNIQSVEDYKAYLRYRLFPQQEAAATQASASNRRTDPTSAYQCVPLKPDQDVKDGKIVIDTITGQPLNQVLLENEQDQNMDIGMDGSITPGDVERIIAIVFGVMIGLFVLSIIAYFISVMTSNNAGPSFPRVRDMFAGMAPSVFIAVVVGVAGFLIGFFAQRK